MSRLFPEKTLARLWRAGVKPNFEDPMLLAKLTTDYGWVFYAVYLRCDETDDSTVVCFDPMCPYGYSEHALSDLEMTARLCLDFRPCRIDDIVEEWWSKVEDE